MAIFIKDERKKGTHYFRTLSYGDVFESDGQFFIKTDVGKKDNKVAIILEKGISVAFPNDCLVNPCECSMTMTNTEVKIISK